MNQAQMGGALLIAFDELERSQGRVALIEKKGRDNALKLRSDLSALQEDVRRRLTLIERDTPKLAESVGKLARSVELGRFSIDESFGLSREQSAQIEKVRIFAAVLKSLVNDLDERLTTKVSDLSRQHGDLSGRLDGAVRGLSGKLKELGAGLAALGKSAKELRGVQEVRLEDGELVIAYPDREEAIKLPKQRQQTFGAGGTAEEWRQNVIQVSRSYAIQAIDLSGVSKLVVLADATAANLTVTIPKAAAYLNTVINVKRMNANSNTVTIDSADLIEGVQGRTISVQNYAVELTPFPALGWVET